MRFTLAQVEAFVRIVDAGSFQKAARQLHVTAPTISQRIQELEGALDTQLFVRTGPRIRLTAQGEALVESARHLLTTSVEIANRFDGNGPLVGALRLGVPHIFGRYCMTDLLSELSRRHPLLKTSVFVGDSGTMTRQLRQRELDLALVLQPESDDRLHRVDLGGVRLSWFCAKERPIEEPMTPRSVAEHHLIFSPSPSRLYSAVTSWLGEEPSQFSTCNDPTILIDVAAKGLGLGALPFRVIEGAVAAGRIKCIDTSPPLPMLPAAICFGIETSPKLKAIVELISELGTRHSLFSTGGGAAAS
ncbi:MAG: LysR family transcriptional regulator [Lautropia sp.]